MTDPNPVTDPAQMIVLAADSNGIAVWPDDKKKDFIATFNARVRASRYILMQTAFCLFEEARRRRFVSERHAHKVWPSGRHAVDEQLYDDGHWPRRIGGRALDDLHGVADQRAKDILAALPPLKKLSLSSTRTPRSGSTGSTP